MSTLKGKSTLSRKKSTEKRGGEYKITTVSSRRNTTTGTSPIPVRLSPNDKAELNLWLAQLSEEAGKPISLAKLLKGLTHMRDKINTKKLMEAIKEANF